MRPDFKVARSTVTAANEAVFSVLIPDARILGGPWDNQLLCSECLSRFRGAFSTNAQIAAGITLHCLLSEVMGTVFYMPSFRT